MEYLDLFASALALTPAALMSVAAVLAARPLREAETWGVFRGISVAALGAAVLGPVLWSLQGDHARAVSPGVVAGLGVTLLGSWLALLVQFLGVVIGAFSARYLEGEPGQARYASALAGVLAFVHLLLLADHWVVLIGAWAGAGVVLQRLLRFYDERPFARLAAHKKRLADRVADVLLLMAAGLAWRETGSGSLSDLFAHVDRFGVTGSLQASAVALVLDVILRTALLPAHGWLIQVMEAPTPVSALLHAGVVNLGGYVLIRFGALLEGAPVARALLVGFGLLTAFAAGLVMLTRISIKVRLAWSTVAQMGFMVLECGLGLHTMAALHLIGHSLYKAHAFLASSSIVRQSRLQSMRGPTRASALSMVAAPGMAMAGVFAADSLFTGAASPWWWNGILAFAWAPLLWLPRGGTGRAVVERFGIGVALLAALAALVGLWHHAPLGLTDRPDGIAGPLGLLGLGVLYVCIAVIEGHPAGLATWRRWSYAGFYVDEFYTRLALRIWPTQWTLGLARGTRFDLKSAIAAPAEALR